MPVVGHKFTMAVFRLGDLPWSNWPEPLPEKSHESSYEDSMHALARVTNKQSFRTPLQVTAAIS